MITSGLTRFRHAYVLLAASCLLPVGFLRGQDATPSSSPAPATPSGSPAPASPAADTSSSLGAPPEAEPAFLAQPVPSYSEASQLGVEGLNGRAIPADAFGERPPGVPYSSVLTTTGADVNDIDTIASPSGPIRNSSSVPTKLGNVEGAGEFGSGLHIGTPFIQSNQEPQADIKAGPLYIKFHSLDGLVLYDDNYLRRHSDRKEETLVLLRLNLSIVAQLADNLQFATTGTIAYLPIQRQFGVQYDVLGLGLFAAPLFAAQLVYDTVIGGWPVRFADDFQSNVGRYSDGARDNFGLFEGDYLTQNQNGGYYFRRAGANPSANGADADDVQYLTNTVSALTDRLLPGDVRLTVRAEHENFWYNQDNRGLAPGRDDLYASLVSEREDQRFKPFISYEASYIEGGYENYGVTQAVNAGFFGPIDDQLFLRASAGYYFDANEHDGELYSLSLGHIAGPYTKEFLVARRYLSIFNDQVYSSYYYLLNQTLGPSLFGSLFLDYTTSRNLTTDSGTPSVDSDIGGVQLDWYLGPRTSLALAGIFEHQDFEDLRKTNTVTGRVTLKRQLSDTLDLELFYQYQRAVSTDAGFSYYENLVYLEIVKFLD